MDLQRFIAQYGVDAVERKAVKGQGQRKEGMRGHEMSGIMGWRVRQ